MGQSPDGTGEVSVAGKVMQEVSNSSGGGGNGEVIEEEKENY